jgi:hypothetical protein
MPVKQLQPPEVRARALASQGEGAIRSLNGCHSTGEQPPLCKPLDAFSKIGFVLPLIQLQIVVAFSSIKKIEDRSVSLRSGATLVSVQLVQFG